MFAIRHLQNRFGPKPIAGGLKPCGPNPQSRSKLHEGTTIIDPIDARFLKTRFRVVVVYSVIKEPESLARPSAKAVNREPSEGFRQVSSLV